MVVNAANTVDFSSIGVQPAKSGDTGVFSKVLRQEINTDTKSAPQTADSDNQTVNADSVNNTDNRQDVIEEITDFIEEKLGEIKSELTDGSSIEDILLKLLELLKNDDKDDSDIMSLLMTAVEQLTVEYATQNAEMPAQTAETAEMQTARTVELVQQTVTVTNGAQNEELAMLFADETPTATAENRQTAEAVPQNAAPTAESPAEIPLPVQNELPQTEAKGIMQSSAQANGIETAEKTADELFNELMNFAKKELGLESAEVETTPVRSEIITTFIRPETEKSSEIDSLIAHITGRTETSQETPQEILPPQQTIAQNTIELPQPELPQTEVRQVPPAVQVADAIASHLETAENGETTFTMVLNPESLGRIAVKLVTNAGKVTVQITAENRAAQELLAQRGENLAGSLKENGIDLEKYQVVYEPQQNSLNRENYNGSSKNPYTNQRNESESDDESDTSFADLLMSM